MPIYSRYISAVGAGIQSINGSVIGAQQIVGSGDVTVSTVTGTGVTTVSLGTPLSTFANTSLSNLVAPTAVNVALLGTLGADSAPAYSFTGDTNTGMFSSGPDTLNFSTNGTERVRITSAGNVGIGTTAPSALLNLSSDTTTTQFIDSYNSTGASANLTFRTARGTAATPTTTQLDDELGFVGARGYASNGFSSGGRAAISFRAAEAFTPSAQGSYITFATAPTGSLARVERVRITSGGAVGINAPTPVTMLDINGDLSSVASRAGATLSTFVDTANGSIVLQRKARGTIAAPTAVQSGDLISYWVGRGYGATAWSGDRAAMVFRASENWTDAAQGSSIAFNTTAVGTTSTTEKMRIDSAGNVGIGRTDPPNIFSTEVNSATAYSDGANQAQRDIAGYVAKNASNTDNTISQMVFQCSNTGVSYGRIGLLRTAANTGSLFFSTGGVTPLERMRIDNAGNVGIGTTNPVSSLAVQRENAITEITNTVYGVSATNLSNLICRSAGGTVASPTAILSGDRILSLLGAGYDGTAFRNQVAVIGESSENWSGTNRGSYLRFETTANASSTRTERMRIASTGNVGIGTTTPTNRLEIQVANSSLVTALALSNHVNYASGRGVGISFRVPLDTPFTTSYAGGFIGSTSEGGSGVGNSNLIFQTASSQTLAERMRIDSAGNVGIGTTAPGDALVISRSGANTILNLQNYGSVVPVFRTQKANGTSASPTQVLSGNDLLRIGGTGYTSGGAFTGDTGRITFQASENFTSTASGTAMLFSTVANGSTTIAERMRITDVGSVGIGGVPNNANDRLHIFGVGGTNTFLKNRTTAAIPVFRGERQNGTTASPTAIVSGNELMDVSAAGYDGAAFSTGRAGLSMFAAQNWTNAAQGAELRLYTTATGSTTKAERMRIDSDGNVLVNHNTLRTNFLNGAQSTRVSLEGTNFIGASYSTVRNSNDINGSWIILGKTRSATNGGNTIVQSGDTVGTVSFQAADGTNLIETGSVSTITTGSPGAGSLSGALVFRTNNAASVTAERMRIDAVGNVGVKATTFGTSAVAAFGIANGTEPTTSVADQIVMGSVDLTAGNTIPYFRSEGTGMTDAGITSTTVTHKIAIKVNGTVYYLLATTNGT